MKVLVCGGRNYGRKPDERALIRTALTRLRPTAIIEGGATGADYEAGFWAKLRHIPLETYKADWNDVSQPNARVRNGRYRPYDANAGPRRNQRMLDEGRPDLVLAFPGGDGTADMTAKARAAGVKVHEVKNPATLP